MSKKQNQEVQVNKGVLNTGTGTILNLIVTKRGVIYFKKTATKK